jgi:hypothetical protein
VNIREPLFPNHNGVGIVAVLIVISFVGFSNANEDVRTADQPTKPIRSVFANPRPNIDGVVDECWLKAHENDGFLQREPEQGQPATTETRFYVLNDYDNLYLLFVMLDPDPDRIPARLVERDYQFYPDDSINFYLDTFNDQQRAYYFCTNPFGVEQDALVSENGTHVEMSWDCVFEVSTKRNKFGWIAEFAIPFKSLRFNGSGKDQVWGFNSWRVRKENREVSFWSLVDRNYDPFRLDKGGKIIIDGGIRSGNHINLLPYTTSRYFELPDQEGDYEAKGGLDAQYGLTSDLTLNLTYNPDFGQVEIDEEQINLDKRFELSLDEKRPFFLENTNLFQLPINTFYSRRIGATSDIKGGLKLTGKAGPYSLGYVGAVTGDWQNNYLGDPDNQTTDEVFNIFRVQRDVFGSSNVGLMFTDREVNMGSEKNNYGFNRSASMDYNLFLGRYQFLTGQVVGSSFEEPQTDNETNGYAARATLGHYDRKYWFYIDGLLYDEEFDVNGTGFFQKFANKGRRELGTYMEIHPFLNRRLLRSWGISSLQRIYRDTDESGNGFGVQNKLWFEFPDQSRITFGVTYYREVESDFLGFRPEYRYDGRDLDVEVGTDIGKPLSGKLALNYSSQYYYQTHTAGKSRGVDASLLVKPLSNWFFELHFENRQFLDDKNKFIPIKQIGQNNIRLFAFRSRYLFTKDIFSRAFVQYSNGAESVGAEFFPTGGFRLLYSVFDRLSANMLLGWRYYPGSTIYLAYTEEWEGVSRLTSRNRIFFFKFSYLWSL